MVGWLSVLSVSRWASSWGFEGGDLSSVFGGLRIVGLTGCDSWGSGLARLSDPM